MKFGYDSCLLQRMHSPGRLSCPICLYPPVAGKMTRCGHVYCWPCILHYLALSDKDWRKCPICYEPVHKKDLKSFVEVSQNHLGVGDEVKLRLMRRERGSLIAVPVCETETALPSNFASVAEANSGAIYSKLLLANVSDVMDIIESERVQLVFELNEDPNSPENCFIKQALTDLLTREKQVSCVLVSRPCLSKNNIYYALQNFPTNAYYFFFRTRRNAMQKIPSRSSKPPKNHLKRSMRLLQISKVLTLLRKDLPRRWDLELYLNSFTFIKV